MVKAKIGFTFDIDGVLIRGGEALEGARASLELLNRVSVPWILLTNGGGMSENDRVADLSRKLGMPIKADQFMQSHTPFKDMVTRYDRILVVGGDKDTCRDVAYEYGAKEVVIPTDIVASFPDVTPYPGHTHTLCEDQHKLKNPEKPFDAIFVFADSRDATTDTQIIVDLLLSEGGVFGTRAQHQTKPSVPIYFSNGDLQWMTESDLPRLGQGAVIAMVEALFKQLTGSELESTIIGKPTKITYDYATKVLNEWCKDEKLDKIYMVGDNQHSDIRGANDYGWESILVRTGVYKDGDEMVTNPTHIVDNVWAAVTKGLEANNLLIPKEASREVPEVPLHLTTGISQPTKRKALVHSVHDATEPPVAPLAVSATSTV